MFEFFFLTAFSQNLFLCFFKKSLFPLLVFYKLEPGICIIIPDISLKFSLAFQNIELVSRGVPQKYKFVQHRDVMKYISVINIILLQKIHSL